MASPPWRTWRTATEAALYGPAGFFRTQAPAEHFRTSVHVSTAFAAALLRLARSAALTTIVDVGSGRGELLTALHELRPDLTLVGVELADRPAALPPAVTWTDVVPDGVEALVVGNEWLDDVPVDVAQVDQSGTVRLVEVDVRSGAERLGGHLSARDADWLARWWPLDGAAPGTRAEIGWPRDDAWAQVVLRLRRGLALAVDYGHQRDDRPGAGTLTGYRGGRTVAAVPDGRCDLTTHVAVDAVAAAGEAAGAGPTSLTRQRAALRTLGVSAARPALTLAHSDPAAYLTALSRTGEAAELLAPDGLGGFWWLLQARHTDLPPGFTAGGNPGGS